MRAVLLDVEGTTTDIAFVRDVLFPYAKERLAHFIAAARDDPAVEECLADVAATVFSEEQRRPDEAALVETLENWMDADRKHPALKKLQGMIWQEGYETGAYTAHVYDDVLPALRDWRAAGIEVAIYSSGSAAAQRLLFAHTTAGDLTPLLSAYFDLSVGSKREARSYGSIARALHLPVRELLFASDVCEELDAASWAGVGTVQVVRPGTEACGRHRAVSSLAAIRSV